MQSQLDRQKIYQSGVVESLLLRVLGLRLRRGRQGLNPHRSGRRLGPCTRSTSSFWLRDLKKRRRLRRRRFAQILLVYQFYSVIMPSRQKYHSTRNNPYDYKLSMSLPYLSPTMPPIRSRPSLKSANHHGPELSNRKIQGFRFRVPKLDGPGRCRARALCGLYVAKRAQWRATLIC
jgi:hypothetical protein